MLKTFQKIKDYFKHFLNYFYRLMSNTVKSYLYISYLSVISMLSESYEYDFLFPKLIISKGFKLFIFFRAKI